MIKIKLNSYQCKAANSCIYIRPRHQYRSLDSSKGWRRIHWY